MTAGFLPLALSGAAATCVGIGLARFAFVPLFPALVTAGWVTGAEAGMLGAAALAGYVGGAMGAQALGRLMGTRPALALGMAGALISLLASAVPGGLAWLLPWRLLAGLAGGVLMSLAGPAIQRAVPPERRGAASGVVVSGVAGGIVLGSLLLPPLLHAGPSAGWLGIAALTALLWAFAQPRFPRDAGGQGPAQAVPRVPGLLLAYALSGAGMVPHMVYLADLAARGFGLGVFAGSGMWLVFGLGALAGTLLGGRLADRLGGARAARLWLWVQLLGLALALLPWWPALILAALLGGFAGVGVSAVTLAWAREAAGAAAGGLWVKATIAYALAQAGAAFALAAVFGATGESHLVVFGLGLALSGLALLAARRP
ncbi:YbfB/YjiJ family MFS transporter [Sediminicoccus sp. KRV36]|uniref:YbfB/YjiJ family MFS transporter n=1 Tax=Sediminicoccus sp. KRV36 TaxID=3133721 RepID=UPI00200DBFB9|nr:YbfB/YjiJ family MFS transporter [Sediminicoccus rosea]UPY36466.1 MFS transporter [Sediminicoccus rosea]